MSDGVDEEIARHWSKVERRFSENEWDRYGAVRAMTRLKIGHDIDTTEMVLEMINDTSSWVLDCVMSHFTEMLHHPPLADTAKRKIDDFLFEPNLQQPTIRILSLTAFPPYGREPRDEEIARWAAEKVVQMLHIFGTLSLDSKCAVGNTIIKLRERDLLEQFFAETRNSNTLKVLQCTAEVLYILDTEFEHDARDPDYFHRKLLDINPKSNKFILFLQLLSRLQYSEVGSEENYPLAQELFQMLEAKSLNFPSRLLRRRLSDVALNHIAAHYGGAEGGYREEGIQSLIKLGLEIPLGYFDHSLDPELTPGYDDREKALMRLPKALSHIEYYTRAINDPNRTICMHSVRRLTEFPVDLHGPVNQILKRVEAEEGTHMARVIQKHLNNE